MIKTAVVILNYNGREWLRKFLPAVIQFSPGAKIIVADNASSDDSAELIKLRFPSVELIQLKENLGFSGGYNAALRNVNSEYYLLLNSDVEVTVGWLEPLVHLLDNRADIAAVQPKILSYQQRDHFDYAGAGGGFIDTMGYPFCRGRIFNSIEEDHAQYDNVKQVFWASGACMLVRANLFEKMGGFDEDFFAHMEEIDLCWKLQRAGHRIYYHGESRIYHVGGGTLSKLNPRKTYLNFRNNLSLIFKHMRSGELIWKLPLRFLLDGIAAMRFLFVGQPWHSWAVAKAQVHFIADLPNCYQKRRALRVLGMNESNQVYSGLIIWDYFLRNKKDFKDLKF